MSVTNPQWLYLTHSPLKISEQMEEDYGSDLEENFTSTNPKSEMTQKCSGDSRSTKTQKLQEKGKHVFSISYYKVLI